jgi:Xaa-Pro aminopeptidase
LWFINKENEEEDFRKSKKIKMEITSLEVHNRMKRLREGMEDEGIRALLLLNPKNLLYLTGKKTGKILININKNDKATLWVKDLYKEINSNFYSSKIITNEFDIIVESEDSLKKEIKELEIKELWVEENLKVGSFRKIEEELKVKLTPTNLIERLRAIKSNYEISLLKKSAKIAKKGMNMAYEIIKDGEREIDMAAEIEFFIRKFGSEAPPFEKGILLSSGKNSVDIHASPTNGKIKNNSIVLVDLGAKFQDYFSDMTRTIKIGELNMKDEILVDMIENLELATIDKVKEGIIEGKELYEFCEKEIKKLGFKFYHSLGHGVGLDIHELPNLGKDSEDKLMGNMVFTIEPGIYIPKKFGVRFEDMILLKKGGGVEILTR